MQPIEIKPKPFSVALRLFLFTFAMFYLAKHCAYGLNIIRDPDFLLILRARAIEAFVSTACFCLVMAVPYLQGKLNIRLMGSTLQAPTQERFRLLKSSTFDISDLSINRSLRDRLIGSQVVNRDGQFLYYFLMYNTKAISKLLDEIERRQAIITNHKHKNGQST